MSKSGAGKTHWWAAELIVLISWGFLEELDLELLFTWQQGDGLAGSQLEKEPFTGKKNSTLEKDKAQRHAQTKRRSVYFD